MKKNLILAVKTFKILAIPFLTLRLVTDILYPPISIWYDLVIVAVLGIFLTDYYTKDVLKDWRA